MRTVIERRAGALLALCALAHCVGCECGEPARPVLRPDPAPVAEPTLPPSTDLSPPRTARTDLPPSTPRVTVTAEPRGYRVSNRELVEGWLPADRARAASAAPPTQPDFPIIEGQMVAVEPVPLLVTGLRDLLALAAQADRARDPAAGAPIGFAIRAPGELPWGRIVRAMYAAAMVGYGEPGLVVRDGTGSERLLTLTSEDLSLIHI